MNDTWRIERLSELASMALEQGSYDGPPSGRVRDVPDVRTIRYYTTLGLIDGPAEMRGRTAYYGRKHLLQLVAIKRLQSRGMSLTEIQTRLVGLSNRQLAKIADLPSAFLDDAVLAKATPTAEQDNQGDETNSEQKGAARAAFWTQAPEIASKRAGECKTRFPAVIPAAILPLAEGMSLLIEDVDASQLDFATLKALAPAAAELRKALLEAGVIQSKVREAAGKDQPGQT